MINRVLRAFANMWKHRASTGDTTLLPHWAPTSLGGHGRRHGKGLIQEISELAMEDTPVAALLRKVQVACTRLRLGPADDWIAHELHGYPSGEVPAYREVQTILMFTNGSGRTPFRTPPDITESLRHFPIRASIGEIDHIVAKASRDHVQMRVPSEFQNALNALLEALGVDALREPGVLVLWVPMQGYIRIREALRERVLKWSLKLEAAGVLGLEHSFTKEEMQVAQTINIHGGNVGAIGGDGVAQSAGPSSTLTAAVRGNAATTGVPDFKAQVEDLQALLAPRIQALEEENLAILRTLVRLHDFDPTGQPKAEVAKHVQSVWESESKEDFRTFAQRATRDGGFLQGIGTSIVANVIWAMLMAA